MASLTETAYFARKGVNIFIILLIVFIILRITWIITGDLIAKYFPKAPPPPNCLFGPLPAPNAVNNIASVSGLIIAQDAVDLPVIPPSKNVYFLPDATSSFGSLDRMKSQASSLGFSGEPQRLTGNLWKFIDVTNPLKTLEIDQLSGNFHLVYNFASELSVFDGKDFAENGSPVDEALGFFESAGLLTDELKNGQPTLTYLKLENSVLVPATSLSNANAIAVTINRTGIEESSIVSPDATLGLVSVLLSGSPDKNKRILEAKYYYRPISLENYATYPTVSLSEAMETLRNGKAIFASVPTPPTKNFNIQKISLGYLDPFPYQPYLQPVYVFSDGKGYQAYVPAVLKECTQK